MVAIFAAPRARLLCGTALVCLSAIPAAAQDAQTEVISLDPIHVRAQDEKGNAADRATAVYVADAELDRARSGDVKDVFAGIASVSVGGAIPMAQKIFVNGVDMLNLTVALDGALQNNRVFHHVSANAFDPGILKFVRVDPGVAAADTGPNAIAGAVIMETVDAADVLEEGDNFGGTVRLSYGDNGKTFGRSLTLATRSGGFEALGYIKSATGDDYEDGSGNTVEGTAADMQSLLLKLAYESDSGHRLEFSGQQMRDDTQRPYRSNIGDVIGRTPSPTRRYDTNRTTYSLRYESTYDTGIWDPEVVIGFSEAEVRVPQPEDSNGVSNTLSAKVQNTFHLSAVNTITAGLDYYDRESEYSSPTTAARSEKADNVGLFAQARLEPTDRWKLSAGLRYDWQDFIGTNGQELSVSGASANISTSVDLTDSLLLRAGYSNVFGGIQLEDNYLFYQNWNYASLQSSRAKNYNMGVDWTSGNLTLSAERFLTKVNDAREDGGNLDFESDGYSIGATYGWDSGFARLTFSDSEIEVNGSSSGSYEARDLGAPLGQVLALQVQQELPQYNLLVGGSLDLARDYDPKGRYAGSVLEGYEVVNIFAEYTPPALNGVTFRASVQNLFDTDFADRATYGGEYASIVPLKEPGRTILLEAVARF